MQRHRLLLDSAPALVAEHLEELDDFMGVAAPTPRTTHARGGDDDKKSTLHAEATDEVRC